MSNATPTYLPGFEPENIKRLLDTFLDDVNKTFPDGVIVWSEWKHEKWDKAAGFLCQNLGYAKGLDFLEAYGYSIVQTRAQAPVYAYNHATLYSASNSAPEKTRATYYDEGNRKDTSARVTRNNQSGSRQASKSAYKEKTESVERKKPVNKLLRNVSTVALIFALLIIGGSVLRLFNSVGHSKVSYNSPDVNITDTINALDSLVNTTTSGVEGIINTATSNLEGVVNSAGEMASGVVTDAINSSGLSDAVNTVATSIASNVDTSVVAEVLSASQTQSKESSPSSVTYTDVDIVTLFSDLKNNAYAAKDKYKNTYVSVRGRLSNIDASGKYISIGADENNYEYFWDSIHCDIKSNEIKQLVAYLQTDEWYTIKGKITDVGEILGYYLQIDEIEGVNNIGNVGTSNVSKTAGEYTQLDITTLFSDLKKNALTAKETYKGAYVIFSGRVSNIDASGKYINLSADENNYEYFWDSVQCFLKDDSTRQALMSMQKDSWVTVKGKITDVGEILGYSLDVIEFG